MHASSLARRLASAIVSSAFASSLSFFEVFSLSLPFLLGAHGWSRLLQLFQWDDSVVAPRQLQEYSLCFSLRKSALLFLQPREMVRVVLTVLSP